MSHGAGHGLVEGENKKIAIIISILALFLAIAETLGKSAQTDALSSNVEASNLWAFFQAKTIRKTTMETAAEQMEIDLQLAKDPATKELLKKRIEGWQSRAARYESEPKPDGKGEGRKELMARAIARREEARRGHGEVPQLRIRLRRVPDRHRAGVVLSHHGCRVSAVGRAGRRRHRRVLRGDGDRGAELSSVRALRAAVERRRRGWR